MGRNADYELTFRANGTYRFARRAEWKALPKAERPSWVDFNGKLRAYDIGSARKPGRFDMSPRGINWRFYGNSTKERARFAGWPDGPMHRAA
jgi:hypothetical protein